MPTRLNLDADDTVGASFFTPDNVAAVKAGLGLAPVAASGSASDLGAGMLPVARLNPSVPVDLLRLVASTIDNRIAGLTASASTKQLFSTYNTVTGSYVRSTTCWAAGIDFSGVSVWTSFTNNNEFPVTAIGPQHVASNIHIGFGNGVQFRWLGSDGNTVLRTVTRWVQPYGGSDCYIGLLDTALPSTVTPVPLAPPNWVTVVAGTMVDHGSVMPGSVVGLPVLIFDQDRNALIGQFGATPYVQTQDLQFNSSAASQRASFWEQWIVGDSSSPVFVLTPNGPFLLGTAHSSGLGTNFSTCDFFFRDLIAACGAPYGVTTALASAANFPTAPSIPWTYLTGVPSFVTNPTTTSATNVTNSFQVSTGGVGGTNYPPSTILVPNALSRLTLQGVLPGSRVEETDRGLRWELLTEHPADPLAWSCLQAVYLLADAVRTSSGEIITDYLQQIVTSRDTPGLLNSAVAAGQGYQPVTDSNGNHITARYNNP